MENKVISVLIVGFIAIVMGIIFIDTVADNIYSTNNLATVTDKAFTASNSSCVALTTTDCVYSLTSVKNTSTTLGSGNYTLCKTTSAQANNGILLTTASLYNGASINATYQQSINCAYVDNAASRSLLVTILIFFAIGILAVAIYYLYQTGILDFGAK